MAKASPLLLTNIRQLLTVRSPNPKSTGPRRGAELNDVGLIEDAAVLCAEGKIAAAGKRREVGRHPLLKSKGKGRVREYDCGGGVVLPGFVDAHTHPAFVAPRLVDFEQRVAGASYEQIAEKGGGIRSSVESVRKATVKELAERVLAALEHMGAQGTTTVEAKSGYGLSTQAELKSLEAIAQAAQRWPGTVVPTLLGAHVVPKEFLGKPQQYVREVTKKMIPQAARRKLAAFVDVFVDHGAFSLADAEQIFEAATGHGLGVRVHICQFTANSVWPLLRFHPASLDHMDNVIEEDLPQLERHGTIVTLVPASNYFLGLGTYPPARRMIDAGVAVALATDYNPGTAPTRSMPFVLSLACTQMKMTPAEAIASATINGAHALRLAHRTGSIEPGKDADFALFDVADYREIPYWIAENRCRATVFGGQLCV
ncbi:MAG TPA: imidazolonepropionase [Terriglobales bacterium]|nr:imidazolonepropionase [Terriglobales bacterium]